MITDSTIEILALKCNSQDLFNAKIIASTNQMISADKKPNLSHLRESGSLEQDSDVVLFIYRPSYYEEEDEGDKTAEIIVGKHRHGPTGTATLVFLDSFTKFADMESNI